MNILLIAGHGAGDSGATGNGYKECDLTREVVTLLEEQLKNYAKVDIYPFSRNAFDDVLKGNIAVNWRNYDYVFEVHFNASNGDGYGTEIYVTREEKGTIVEEKIMEKLSKFFIIRGVKRKNFAVIKSVSRQGVSSALLETCFIDNNDDIEIYSENKTEIVKAIADGIIDGFNLSYDPSEETGKIYKNGSTPEPVYSDYYLTQKIGELNPYEECILVDVYDGRPVVRYEVDGTRDENGNFNEKIGFVEWTGGIE